ncbi:MAG: hypothetical protein QMC37_01055, partial [Flavobacteriales bacterium]
HFLLTHARRIRLFFPTAHAVFDSTDLVLQLENVSHAVFVRFLGKFGTSSSAISLFGTASHFATVFLTRNVDMVYNFMKTVTIGHPVDDIFEINLCSFEAKKTTVWNFEEILVQAFITQLRYSHERLSPVVYDLSDAVHAFLSIFAVSFATISKAFILLYYEAVFYGNQYVVVLVNSWLKTSTAPTARCLANMRDPVAYYYRGLLS